MLIVHSDPKSEAVPEQEQMPSRATANIDHAHPLRDDIVKELGASARKKAWISSGCVAGLQSPIQ